MTLRRDFLAFTAGAVVARAILPAVAHAAPLVIQDAGEVALLDWYRRSPFSLQKCAFNLVVALQAGVPMETAVTRYEREVAGQSNPEYWRAVMGPPAS